MKIKKRMITIGIIMMGCLLLPNQVRAAALQANGGTATGKNLGDWLIGIRQMQEAGGALGLTDTIQYDENNVENSKLTSDNTNLDIHMEKSTEYGAMIILSASAYGNPVKIEDGQTTTGNKTGVVMKFGGEWNAGGAKEMDVANFKSASARYKNIYETSKEIKVGDALDICTWHGAGASYEPTGNTPVSRGMSGSFFTLGSVQPFQGGTGLLYSNCIYSRAVVVVGAGI